MTVPTNIDGSPIEGRQATIPVTVMNASLAAGDGDIGIVGLQNDAQASHGSYTVNITASIAVPAWAAIARIINPSAQLDWACNAAPAAGGSGSLATGGYALANAITAVIVRGAATLQLRSAASTTVLIEFRGPL